MGGFFLEEDELSGCRNKWRGSTWGPRGRGRALDPRGQVVAPPGVFSVPDILKYSTKNIFNFQDIWRTFIFGVFFIARIIQKTDRKYHFSFIKPK